MSTSLHARNGTKEEVDEALNSALEDTFPASDPLPLTPGTGVGAPRRKLGQVSSFPASKLESSAMSAPENPMSAPPTSVEKIASLVAGGMMSLWALRQGGLLGTLGVLAAGALLARGMAEGEKGSEPATEPR